MAAINDFRTAAPSGARWEPPSDNDSTHIERDEIFQADENPNQIVTFAPKEGFRLVYFDVMCLLVNRMIGKF